MKRIIFLLSAIALLFMASCKKKVQESNFNFGTERYDSAALHLALVPNHDCLPIYFAERSGIYDSLGLKLQISSNYSQMDCDTTLMGRLCDGGWADRIRMDYFGKKMSGLSVMWESTQRWALFTSGKLRLRDVESLEGKTVGIARSTTENKYLDALLKSSKADNDKVYRPLINDLKMRAQMLTGDQIDAAIIAWPYTSLAYANGHRCIAMQTTNDYNGCFVMKKDRLKKDDRKKQWDLLEKGRQMAIDTIRVKGAKAYSIVLQKDYGLPKEVADTIKW